MSVTRRPRFALLVAVNCPSSKTSSIVTFAKKVSDRDLEPEKRQLSFFSSLSSFKGHVRRTDSVYRFLGIRSIRALLGFETRLILETPADGRPTKVFEKCPISGKAYVLKGEFMLGWVFERRVWFPL